VFGNYGALTTRPDLMQLVQTAIFFTLPLRSALTFWRLGLNLRLVTLCAWLILLPTIGFFPHISHILDIIFLLETDGFVKSHDSDGKVKSALW